MPGSRVLRGICGSDGEAQCLGAPGDRPRVQPASVHRCSAHHDDARRRPRGGPRWSLTTALCIVLGLLLGATWGLGGAAGAQEAPRTDLNERAVGVAIAFTQANARLIDIDHAAADITARLALVSAALQAAELQLAAAQADLSVALDRLQGRAANSYRLGGAALDPVLNIDRLESLSIVTKYVNAAATVSNAEVERLTEVVVKLTATRDAAAAQQQVLSARLAHLAEERATLSDEAHALEYTLAQLGGVPISGESALTAAQMTAWFESTGARANLPDGTTIADLAQMYLEEGTTERVRPDLAFAQSVLETGSFRETRGNNYAGIGNCDSCGGKGMVFRTPRDGVRAQIQLLRNYADPDSRAANLSHPPDATLHGADPAGAAAKYDSFSLKGKVPLWNEMGNGNWATSTTYAPKVLGVYAQMLAFAKSNR